MSAQRMTRRSLLKRTVGAVTAFTIVPRFVLGGPGNTPPSEQITKGIIGVGGMGKGHIRDINPDARLLAVCDTDAKHLKEGQALGGAGVEAYRDFREMLARPDIDIIHIATPPHWHALMSIMAAQAGKDIWCEKPMSRTIGEGKKVVEAINRYGRIFRLNTWFRFEAGFYGFGTTVQPIKKVVDSGLLGWPLRVTVNDATGFGLKLEQWTGLERLDPQPIPPELDYDMWLGPAPYKPYHPHRVHGSFRGYWDYDGGGLGDMGQHYLDPVQYFLGKDDTSPVEIEVDTPIQHPDAVRPWWRLTMRYADGCEIVVDPINKDKDAAYIQGPKGKLYPGMRSDIPDFEKKLASFPEPKPQTVDFLESVRTRRKFALNEQNGHRSCTIVNLGKCAVQLGRSLKYDPVKQEFVDDPEANRLIDQPMRAPWHL
ncbi:MAG TPA: Gfo/Idh/MocA family oxidoreductase [Candidatus Sumerlaeota bacterium]|nr:Gfo/Idh/MocA family oxidoreductase [Candidatus Sumerlaeota bacterium]HPS03250.1 Gfo/Idh/MocA family oxidoreductase [Candidatus Sumerlaeota bacterium]